MSNQSRLEWRCRRGIKEMDLVCQRFLEHAYPDLPEEQKALFEEILDENDLDILEWILGRSKPARQEYESLILIFRELQPD